MSEILSGSIVNYIVLIISSLLKKIDFVEFWNVCDQNQVIKYLMLYILCVYIYIYIYKYTHIQYIF